jgi:hypothetical protein
MAAAEAWAAASVSSWVIFPPCTAQVTSTSAEFSRTLCRLALLPSWSDAAERLLLDLPEAAAEVLLLEMVPAASWALV